MVMVMVIKDVRRACTVNSTASDAGSASQITRHDGVMVHSPPDTGLDRQRATGTEDGAREPDAEHRFWGSCSFSAQHAHTGRSLLFSTRRVGAVCSRPTYVK